MNIPKNENIQPKSNLTPIRTKLYTIPGEPVAIGKVNIGYGKFYNSQQEKRFKFRNFLELQHNEEPFFSGPIRVDLIFNFKLAQRNNRKFKDAEHRSPMYDKPTLLYLLDFMHDMMQGTLYDNDVLITSLSCQKFYDNNPRTDLIITEIR